MNKLFLCIIGALFLCSCGSNDDDSNLLHRRFAVADFCYEDVMSYFERGDIQDLGALFEFTKFDRRLLGMENIIGMAKVSSSNLKKMDLDSLINGALSNCHPNMKSAVSLNDEMVKRLLEQSDFLGKQLDSNYLIRINNEGMVIYTRESS